MADRVYGVNWKETGGAMVNQQLNSIFLDGLRSLELKARLFEKGLATFAETVKEAKKEDVTRKRFHSSIMEEEMKVNHRRPRGPYGRTGPHWARHWPNQKQTKPVSRVRMVWNKETQQQQEKRDWRHKTESRRIGAHPDRVNKEDREQGRCFKCHMAGHFIAQCRRTPDRWKTRAIRENGPQSSLRQNRNKRIAEKRKDQGARKILKVSEGGKPNSCVVFIGKTLW